MSKKTDTLTRLGLYVTETHDSGYYHVIANIVTIGHTTYERRAMDRGETGFSAKYDTIRNAGDDLERGLYLANFRVNSQGETSSPSRHLYGWDVEYRDVFSIDARKAERMAKTLKTIAARMDKLDTKYGRPATFGAYLARVADAIGAEEIIRPDGPQRGWSYNESSQTHYTIHDGIYYVDQMIARWAKAATAETAVSA